jgi:hypothetical protein
LCSGSPTKRRPSKTLGLSKNSCSASARASLIAVGVDREIAGGERSRPGCASSVELGASSTPGVLVFCGDRVVGVALPVGLVRVEVGAVLGGDVGAGGLVLRVVHGDDQPVRLADDFEFEAAALGVLRVALDHVHHLGLAAGEGGLLGVEAAGVGEGVPDVDGVALVEAGEAELALRDRVELRAGDEERGCGAARVSRRSRWSCRTARARGRRGWSGADRPA